MVDGLAVRNFDFWMSFEARQDAILAAFAPATRSPSAGSDYVAFADGYRNSVTRFRLFGREVGESDVVDTPGAHTMQLWRRSGRVWMLFDGRPVMVAPDPRPEQVVDRLAAIGGYGGDQVVRELRIRLHPPETGS